MKQESKFLSTSLRLLKMIHNTNRDIIPLYLLQALIKSVYPYLNILISAQMIDLLIRKQWEQAFYQMLFLVLGNFLFGIALDYINSKCEIASMTINRQCNSSVILKAISLDYQTFEKKKNLEEFEAADYNVQNNGGFGFYCIAFSKLVTGILGCIISFILLIRMCLSKSSYTGMFSFLITPIGSILTMGLLIAVMIICYFCVSSYVNEKTIALFPKMVKITQIIQYFSYDLFQQETFAKEIRMYRMRDMLYQEWKQAVIKEKRLENTSYDYRYCEKFTTMLGNNLILLFSYLFVAFKTFANALSIGMFTQYIGSMRQMNTALVDGIDALQKLKLQQSYLLFYTDFLEKKNQMDTGSLPVEKRNDHEYEIEFHDVSFHYPNSQEYVLKHVSFKLDMKHHFALVGKNGAGKTTLIKLLCRLYDVSEGSITLNGVDIRKYDYDQYLNLFAAVFQDFTLFSIPVKENVACKYDGDEAKIWNVLKQAGVQDRIQKMKEQLDTRLFHDMGEGEDVSGGEAQKIAIARALYKDAPFVILDEPTAALDPISEYEIYRHFDEMVQDKTSIYISHRMSSCRFCDDILVFDKGKLIQRGNHDMLMKDENNVYAKLWRAQAKYYEEEQKDPEIK